MEQTINEALDNKVVLVTGGTGSIGKEIVRKLLKYPVKQVRIFSRGEYKQYLFEQELKDQLLGRVSFLIGDIRDKERVCMAMEGVDIVFNAAAMKHVPICEFNPFEALKTNVVGTQNVVDAARAENIEKFVHISTDKAATPVNVMGATKLLAERMVISASSYKGSRRTVFSAVRFGNVFGSRGSVVPLFLRQIKDGGPVTLTDKDMTRFIMRIPQAADLVIRSCALSKGEELFILKMPVMKMEDLASCMIEYYTPKFGRDPKDISTEIIGKRSGEKKFELLMTDDEAEGVYENADMLCLSPHPIEGFSRSGIRHYRSDDSQVMDKKQIMEFLAASENDLEALE